MNTPECRIYTAKVLSNGRLLRWIQAATYGEMEPEGIHQITGDTPMRQGGTLLEYCKNSPHHPGWGGRNCNSFR